MNKNYDNIIAASQKYLDLIAREELGGQRGCRRISGTFHVIQALWSTWKVVHGAALSISLSCGGGCGKGYRRGVCRRRSKINGYCL